MPRRLVAGAGLVGAAVAFSWALAPVALADFTTAVAPVTGLAADPGRQLYWATGSSKPTVTALAADGSTRRTVSYDARPVDVEALSFRDGRLWIGDVGDRSSNRGSVTLYRLGTFGDGTTVTPRRYVLTYPDGAHDAGAMAVSSRGRAYLVTRGSKPAIYRTAGEPVAGGTANKLVRVASAPDGVTDAVFTTDSSRLVLRTGNGLYVVDPYNTFRTVASAPLPASAAMGDGQALAMMLGSTGQGSGKVLVSGSSSPTRVTSVAMPTSLEKVPSPTPSASPSPSGTSGTEQVGTHGKGTVAALVAAGVISLLAAVVVAVKH